MYQAIYKCRLCGEIYITFDTSNEKIAEECTRRIIREENYYFPDSIIEVHRLDYHNCQDGSFGFSDFQGFKKVEG